MATSQLGFVPHLREGALIFTAIVFRFILNGCTHHNHAIAEVNGSIGSGNKNLFGERVRFFSQALFADSKAPEDVLMHHTLIGIYSRAMTKESAGLWIKSALEARQEVRPRNRFRQAVPRGFRHVLPDLRSCSKCMKQDIDEFGFPSWYLLHVLPPVHHCPYHGQALVTEATAGLQGRWKLKLPTGRSSDSVRLDPEFASNGYASYLRRWVEVFEGGIPTISADTWPDYIDLVVRDLGGTERATKALSSELESSWGMHPVRLPQLLGSHLHSDFVKDELEHRSGPVRVAQKLIILDACESLGFRRANGAQPEQLGMPLPSNGVDSESCTREKTLRRAFGSRGVPLVIVPSLSEGYSAYKIGKRHGVSDNVVYRAIDQLSLALLEELSAMGSWPADSWLVRALRNRKKETARY